MSESDINRFGVVGNFWGFGDLGVFWIERDLGILGLMDFDRSWMQLIGFRFSATRDSMDGLFDRDKDGLSDVLK